MSAVLTALLEFCNAGFPDTLIDLNSIKRAQLLRGKYRKHFARLESGRIDLKKHGIMPIFSAARVAALTHGVAARSTPERLEALRRRELAEASLIGKLIEAHKILLGAILKQQLRDIQAGVKQSNRVAPGEMEPHERQQLTWALGQVDNVRNLLGTPGYG